MIKRIYSSNLESFKTQEFKPGLNILLSIESSKSSKKDSRNGTGKSSLIELVHFLLGGNCSKKSIFLKDKLKDCKFGIEIELDNETINVVRSGRDNKYVYIENFNKLRSSLKAKARKDRAEPCFTNDTWSDILGIHLFNLNLNSEEENIKYAPSFRLIFPYFARRESDSGYISPENNAKHVEKAPWQKQVCLSYLLGLNWTIASDFEKLSKTIKVLKTISEEKDVFFKDIIGEKAKLKSELTVITHQYNYLKDQIINMNLLKEYNELEKDANDLTFQLNDLLKQNALDDQLIEHIQLDDAQERPPDIEKIKRLYEEVEIILPEIALNRFDEVIRFHDSIIKNRRIHLEHELIEAKNRKNTRNTEINNKEKRRNQILRKLKGNIAWEQYIEFQSELSRKETEMNMLESKYEIAVYIEEQKERTKEERHRLKRLLSLDFQEREKSIEKAIIVFKELSTRLYGERKSGNLMIKDTDKGPSFEPSIPKGDSTGITKMQIFCFDMMLMSLCRERKMGIDFIFHDSILFDPTEPKQKAQSIMLGKELAEKHKFQYIISMIDSHIPRDYFTYDFNYEDYLLPNQLTDSETGGLFGFEF